METGPRIPTTTTQTSDGRECPDFTPAQAAVLQQYKEQLRTIELTVQQYLRSRKADKLIQASIRRDKDSMNHRLEPTRNSYQPTKLNPYQQSTGNMYQELILKNRGPE